MKVQTRLISTLLIISLIIPFQSVLNLSRLYARDNSLREAKSQEFMDWMASNEENRRAVNAFLGHADSLDAGQLPDISPAEADAFLLGEQYIEIINPKTGEVIKTISFNTYHAALPNVPFTKTTVTTNESDHLVVEAHLQGQVVARQVIPRLKVKSFYYDNYLVYVVDHFGNHHVLDMGITKNFLTKSPIPVIQKIFEGANSPGAAVLGYIDRKELGRTKAYKPTTEIRVEFITRGTDPATIEDYIARNPDAVVMRNMRGEPLFSAGDIIVEKTTANGQKKLVGIFSRDVVYQRITEGAMFLQWLCVLVSPESASKETLQTILEQSKAVKNMPQMKSLEQDVANSSILRRAILNFNPDSIDVLQKRADALAGIENAPGIRDELTDRFTLQELKTDLIALRTKAEEIERKEQAEEATSNRDPIDLDRLGEHLPRLIEPIKGSDHLKPTFKERVGRAAQKVKKGVTNLVESYVPPRMQGPLKVLGVVAVVGATGAAVGGAGAAALAGVQYAAPVGMITALSWAYINWYPAVLKEAAFIQPLIKSVIAMFIFYPLAALISAVSVPIMSAMARLHPTSAGKAKWKDIYERWGTLTVWGRIVSMGMRGWASVLYPFWNWTIGGILRQTDFIPTLEARLNPFRRVRNQNVNNGRPTYLGINNPLARGKNFEQAAEGRQLLRSVLIEQRKRVNSQAWRLATVIVSSKFNVDPATILMVSNNQLQVEQLPRIMKDPVLKREWALLNHAISSELVDLGAFGDRNGTSSINPSELAAHYAIASEVAENINRQSAPRQLASYLWIGFKEKLADLSVGVLGFGRKQYNALMNVYANQFVGSQTRSEFAFDHFFVTIEPAFWGDRANPKDPGSLTFKPEGGRWYNLWTNPGHVYDVVYNIMLHFFMAGSLNALAYQEEELFKKEERYQPMEAQRFALSDRKQGFWRGAAHWISNFKMTKECIKKHDMGGYYMINFKNTLASIQAFFLIGIVFRWGIGGQTLNQAFRAFLLFYIARPWTYYWPWPIIGRGNNMMDGDITEAKKEYSDTLVRLSQALRELQATEGENKEALKKAYRDLVAMHERHNPKVTTRLFKTLELYEKTRGPNSKGLAAKLSDPKERKNVPESFGLAAALAKSMLGRDQKASEENYNRLVAYISESGDMPEHELRQLSSRSLLDFSLRYPAVYTRQNPIIPNLTVLTGAVTTTLMAVALCAVTFKPEYLTFRNIEYYVALNMFWYSAVYGLISKNAVELYENRFSKLRQKVGDSFGACRSMATKKSTVDL